MVLYYSKRTDVLEREEGRIMQDEKRAGQEIRKGDTLEVDWYKEKIIDLLGNISEREAALTYQFLKSIKK
jgi:hypothetical protein